MDEITKHVGSGITKRDRSFRQFSTNEADAPMLEKALTNMVEMSRDPWAKLQPAIDAAKQRLADIEAQPHDATTFVERVGIGWYLREIIMHAALARHHIDAGNASWAACEGLAVGEALTEMGIKFEWEKRALAGDATIEGAREGAAKRAEAFKPRHDEIRADFEERLNRTNDEQRAKNATAREFEITRRHLNRILAK